MSPDDLRHGTHRGYVVGCRDRCCTRAHNRYMKLYRMGRRPRLIDSIGTRRRIEALWALGWTSKDVGLLAQRGDEWARMLARSPTITSTNAALVAKVYDHLCMSVPTGAYFYARNRRWAASKGYVPPLAWDDIDDPAEEPQDWRYVSLDRAEALTELDALHLGISEVCARLSIRRDNLERWCERHDMREVYVRMCGRETWREVAS